MNVNERIQLNENDKISLGAFNGVAVFKEALYVAAAVALGRAELPFGIRPFGFAALCASGGHALSVFAGLCLSLIGRPSPLIYLAAYALTLLLRGAFSVMGHSSDGRVRTVIFREHISLRIVCASIGVFGVGLYNLLKSGFLYYDLYGAILGIITSAISATLMYALEKKKPEELWHTAGTVTLMCAVTWGLRDIGFYGISVSALFAMFMSLTVMRKRGILTGLLVAISTGLCVSVSYAPLFVFATVAYGSLSLVSPFLGMVASLAVGLGWGIYIDGISALSALLPALLAANLIFLVADRLYFADRTEKSEESVKAGAVSAPTDDISLARLNDAAERIKLLCEGFSSLSDMLLRTDIAHADQELSMEIGEMDGESEGGYYNGYLADSLRSASLAADFRAISDYLAGIMVENEQSYYVDAELSGRVSDALTRDLEGAELAVTVFGDSRKRISVCSSDAGFLRRNAEQIKRTVCYACGFALMSAEVQEIGGRAILTFTRAPLLDIVSAGRKRNSEGEEEFCGDSFGVIPDKDRTYAFISDGMGSGREAAVTSGLCALFLQKLLPVNCIASDCITSTLEALNGFLCSRNGAGVRECAATVDLGVFDLVNCRAQFYKSGAAPTYVFRDGALFKVRSRTVPIGIVREPDIGKINMELLPGDVIVMVSDGVTQGREECPELFELLRSRLLTHTSEQLADAVMDYADEAGCTDDVSVLVLKVSERPLTFM